MIRYSHFRIREGKGVIPHIDTLKLDYEKGGCLKGAAVADLHIKVLEAPPHPRSNFLHFHAVSRNFCLNNGLSLSLCKILDPPLSCIIFMFVSPSIGFLNPQLFARRLLTTIHYHVSLLLSIFRKNVPKNVPMKSDVFVLTLVHQLPASFELLSQTPLILCNSLNMVNSLNTIKIPFKLQKFQ